MSEKLPDCCYCYEPIRAGLGRHLYAAYNRAGERKGLNFRGDPCPLWDELPEDVRVKWDAVAAFAVDAVRDLGRREAVVGLEVHVGRPVWRFEDGEYVAYARVHTYDLEGAVRDSGFLGADIGWRVEGHCAVSETSVILRDREEDTAVEMLTSKLQGEGYLVTVDPALGASALLTP